MEALSETEAPARSDGFNRDERVVAIRSETKSGERNKRYAIYDCDLQYWRGTSGLDECDAWTRDTKRRVLFRSRADAKREMKAIWRHRGSVTTCKR